jgi:hypothetical protein
MLLAPRSWIPIDYVRLGTDRSFNRRVRVHILAKNGNLYEDMRVVREFERFFESAVAAERLAATK